MMHSITAMLCQFDELLSFGCVEFAPSFAVPLFCVIWYDRGEQQAATAVNRGNLGFAL